MITFYQRDDCPFCWKVRIALAETGLAHVLITASGQHETVQRLSPQASVPVMTDGDLAIWDSPVMLEYLAERAPAAGLLPAGIAARAQARLIHQYSDRLVGPALRDLIFEKRSKAEPDWDHGRIAASLAAWRACLVQLAGWLGHADAFADAFSMAECALLPRFALARHWGADLTADFPALARWYATHSARESVRTAHAFSKEHDQ